MSDHLTGSSIANRSDSMIAEFPQISPQIAATENNAGPHSHSEISAKDPIKELHSWLARVSVNDQSEDGSRLRKDEIEERLESIKLTADSWLKELDQLAENGAETEDSLAERAQAIERLTLRLSQLIPEQDRYSIETDITAILCSLVKLLNRHIVIAVGDQYDKMPRSSQDVQIYDAIRDIMQMLPKIGWAKEAEDCLSPEDHQFEVEVVKILAQFARMPWSKNFKMRAASDFFQKRFKSLFDDNSVCAELWQDRNFINLVGIEVAEQISNKGVRNLDRQTKFYLDRALSTLGFNELEQDSLTMAWNSFDFGEKDEPEMNENLNDVALSLRLNQSFEVMTKLRDRDPELPHKLFKTFGIRNFYRFSNAEVLLNQWQDFRMATGKLPRKIVILAAADNNNALNDPDQYLGSLQPIFFEAANLEEFARAVLRARRKFGKISTLVVNAHGDPEGFELGNHKTPNSYVTSEMFSLKESIEWIKGKDIFDDQAKVIFFSCSTGSPGGIAQNFSSASGIDTLAPSLPISGHIKKNEDGSYSIEYVGFPEDDPDQSLPEPEFNEAGEQVIWGKSVDYPTFLHFKAGKGDQVAPRIELRD